MRAKERNRKLRKLVTLRDHPGTPKHEREAAAIAIKRIEESSGPVQKEMLCSFCAAERGLIESEAMVFSTEFPCSECGGEFAHTSEDWV